MKRIKLVVSYGLIIAVLCGCTKTADLSDSVDYGNAGIYDLDGNLIVPYETLVRKYQFDVSKNYENDENQGFSEILQKLDLNEEVKLVVPQVSEIGEYALAYAEELAYCDFPDTLETIGGYAFYESGLCEIVIPSRVSEISHNAFDSCRELSGVTLNDGLKVIDVAAFRYTPNLTEIEIPETVEFIGACAFQDTGIEYVQIPDTVSSVGDFAFGNVGTVCYNGNAEDTTGFGAVNFHQFNAGNVCDLCGASMDYVPYTIQGAEFIDNGVCDIPETFDRDGMQYRIVAIEAGAYKDNQEMTSLTIPDSVQNIRDEAFANCVNLKKVELNEHLQELGQFVFVNCTSLEEIVIPDQVLTINGCFGGCTNLRDVTLPNKISFDTTTFDGCDHLERIHYFGTEEEWKNIPVGAPAPIMETTVDRIFDSSVTVYFEGTE